jgi:hypothetical protein
MKSAIFDLAQVKTHGANSILLLPSSNREVRVPQEDFSQRKNAPKNTEIIRK